MHDKAIMWLDSGVRVVWVVLPERRSVDVYRSARQVDTVAEPNALEGGDILPDFRCEVAEIMAPGRPLPSNPLETNQPLMLRVRTGASGRRASSTLRAAVSSRPMKTK